MSIYKLRAEVEAYQSFHINPDAIYDAMGDDFALNFGVKGESVKKAWVPVHCEFFQPEEFPTATPIPDLGFWQTGILVLSAKAHDVLVDELEKFGGFLELTCGTERYYLFNTLHIKSDEVIDFTNSEQDVAQGLFMGIKRLAFNESMVIDNMLFKIRYDQLLNIYASEKFKAVVEKYTLEGLVFNSDLACF
ncbi:MAG: hypothetical protein COA99_17020 [Moraxellaceae bacterium]|nr:MAG: hypothetical protein COA99_17020 [Moraxellaceae bacterium]